MQSFSSPTVMLAFIKDPDELLDYNEDTQILSDWKCVDLKTS